MSWERHSRGTKFAAEKTFVKWTDPEDDRSAEEASIPEFSLEMEEATLKVLPDFEYLHRCDKDDNVVACDCKPEDDCSKRCVNLLLHIECRYCGVPEPSPHFCPTGNHCKNQRFQQLQYPRLMCFDAGEKGYGLMAKELIEKNSFIIEYVGEVITIDQVISRLKKKMHGKHCYYLTLDQNVCIDAHKRGNIARFINHSCKPNAITQKWSVNGSPRIGLFAKQDIQAGEEITFDYNFERFGWEAQKCLCGSENCRGVIGAKSVASQRRKDKRAELVMPAYVYPPLEHVEWFKRFNLDQFRRQTHSEFLNFINSVPPVGPVLPSLPSRPDVLSPAPPPARLTPPLAAEVAAELDSRAGKSAIFRRKNLRMTYVLFTDLAHNNTAAISGGRRRKLHHHKRTSPATLNKLLGLDAEALGQARQGFLHALEEQTAFAGFEFILPDPALLPPIPEFSSISEPSDSSEDMEDEEDEEDEEENEELDEEEDDEEEHSEMSVEKRVHQNGKAKAKSKAQAAKRKQAGKENKAKKVRLSPDPDRARSPPNDISGLPYEAEAHQLKELFGHVSLTEIQKRLAACRGDLSQAAELLSLRSERRRGAS